jgi:hypothetical protein
MSDFGADFHEVLESKDEAYMEGFNIQPEISYDIPGVETALVYGNPYEAGEYLDDYQGDNKLGAEGDCGLVSVSNLLTLCGIKSDEESITEYAVENALCSYSEFLPPESRGGTTDPQICQILRQHGVESSAFSAQSVEGNCESMAEYVEAGHGVLIGINAGYGWQDANYIGDGTANHEITVTGTVRDALSGELKGFIVCDSGLTDRSSASRFVSLETMRDAYENIPGASAIVTDEPLRKL